jgi:hypothetical protein
MVNKTTNVKQLGTIVFIIPCKALYLFRVLFTPIISSVLKLYRQLLVQSRIGMLSDLVCFQMIGSRERTARIGMVSDLVCYKMIRSRERTARIGMLSDLVCYKMIRIRERTALSAVRSRLLIIW